MTSIDSMILEEKLDIINRYLKCRYPEENWEKLEFRFAPECKKFLIMEENEEFKAIEFLEDIGASDRFRSTKKEALDAWLQSHFKYGSLEEMALWLEIAGE